MENRLVPPRGIALDTHRVRRRARQGPRGTALRRGCGCSARSWQRMRIVRPARAPTRCSAWAATSASRAGWWRGCCGKPLAARQCRRGLLLSNRALAAVARAHRVRLRRRRGAHGSAQASSPAIRCARRSRRCRAGASASPGRSGALRAARRRRQPRRARRSTNACRRRSRCARRRSGRASSHQTGAGASRRGARGLRRSRRRTPRCCRSSTTWRRASPSAT